jgi:nitroreductase
VSVDQYRTAAYPIDRAFIERWSPRSFTDATIPDDVLFTAFEAARWAPSSFNMQPWRFIYAKRRGAGWQDFLSFTVEFNRHWAQHASALVLFISETSFERNGVRHDSPTHAFDTGAAWAAFAHQAHLLGWHTHGMAGFDRDEARRLLGIQDGFAPQALAAIGKIGPKAALPESLQAREFPSDRRPLSETAFEGRFHR